MKCEERRTLGEIKGEHGTEDGGHYVDEVGKVPVDWHDNVGYTVGIAGIVAEPFIQFRELHNGLILMTEGLHYFLTSKHLLNKAVHLAEALLLLAEMVGGNVAEFARGDNHNNRHNHGEQC